MITRDRLPATATADRARLKRFPPIRCPRRPSRPRKSARGARHEAHRPRRPRDRKSPKFRRRRRRALPLQTSPPSPTLQTTTNVEEVEQRVRATIAQASRDLGRIDARALNAEAKAQYDIAKRLCNRRETR